MKIRKIRIRIHTRIRISSYKPKCMEYDPTWARFFKGLSPYWKLGSRSGPASGRKVGPGSASNKNQNPDPHPDPHQGESSPDPQYNQHISINNTSPIGKILNVNARITLWSQHNFCQKFHLVTPSLWKNYSPLTFNSFVWRRCKTGYVSRSQIS